MSTAEFNNELTKLILNELKSSGRDADRADALSALATARAEGFAEGAKAMRERAANVVANPDRTGREWANGSLWGNISADLAAAIRALPTFQQKDAP